MRTPGISFLLLILLCHGSPSGAQQPLRVGVVLSGGGAKGIAHVGVLKVLEEAGIRIDYIGGTSMGAIVGGLYASGLSAAQLDTIFRTYDIEEIMQDRIARTHQPFFEKQYGEKYALSLSFRDFKVALPSAFSNGQTAFDFMSQLTDPVSDIEDFSLLPIPFLCIGTDVTDGSQVVFETGCLARAMRASGALPGVIAPVEVAGRLIADGGVVNNFPAREIRAKGMDIVIGSTVESGLYKKEELQSVEKIIEQVGSYQMEARSREQMNFCNLVIRPDISGYGVTSFDAADSILLRGETGARKQLAELTEIAKRQKAAPQPPARARTGHAEDCPMVLANVHLEPNKAITKPALLSKFPVKLPGELTFEQCREGLTALYATGSFQFLDYHFKTDSSGIRDLFIQPVLKPGYERSLRLGLHYDNVYKSSLLVNATFRNLLFNNSIAALDVIIGDKPRFNAHYFVDRGRLPGFGFNSRLNRVDLFVNLPVQVDIGGSFTIQNLLFDLTDFTNEVYANFAAGNHFAAGLAAEIKFFKTATSQAVNYLTDENYIDESGWYTGGRAFFRLDTRDRIFFTRSGTLTSLDVRGSVPVSSVKYAPDARSFGWNFDFRIQATYPLSARVSATISADAGLTRGTPAPPYRYFLGSINRNLINNFRPFPGLAFAEASGDNLLGTGLVFQYQIAKNHFVTVGGHVASLLDMFNPFSDGKGLYRSLGFSYGLDTALGPLEVTYGVSNRGSELYFNLGYWF
jgi:NTE family protein